ncbi:MAG: homoserine O-acetyltransferase [Nitrospirae bacterium]|nr:homoserine O-acetyltransferase [Nitrospirota bacterium]NTW65343.1 homoserine O-acetyltransferase [Nitrospirota bacterium]
MSIVVSNSTIQRNGRLVGETETRTFTFETLRLESGEVLSPVTIAYETYGSLNAGRNNVVLLCHALSGDAHAAGQDRATGAPGWWDSMVGPGKAFDTEKYFIVCSNVLGGCKGTTGPSSIDPATSRPYGLDFPVITIGDMVSAQARLMDHLDIKRLLAVAGGSMGGMQALEWLVSRPGRVQSAIAIATAARHSPQQIAFHEVGRQAIMADPNWKEGNYYGGPLPGRGLAVARMVGHITYMSDLSMEVKFGRRFREDRRPFKFTADFEVEGYLHHRGNSFVERFDANSYLYITKAMDFYDAGRGRPLAEALSEVDARALVVAFKSDWLYPAYQSQEIAKSCKLAGLDATYCEVDSTYGHDAFLLETDEETHLIRHFLDSVSQGRAVDEDEI